MKSGSGVETELTLRPSVLTGKEALAALADPTFVAQWSSLLASCPWATTFQSPAFARIWFSVYGARYTPVFVLIPEGDGLAALIPLARETSSGAITHVGAHHAEYHGWLARPEHAERAPVEMLLALRSHMKGGTLRLLFLSPGTPMSWVPAAEAGGLPVVIRWHSRGLLRVGPGSDIEASLRKSANKSRVSRLRRLGPVSFTQLHTRSELASVISTIADQCDVRQGGVHATTPFLSDPLKREWYLALMDEPGLAHATVLRVGDEVLASHLSVQDPRGVPLGLITFAPQFAAHSPGKLLLLFLGRLLGEQGYSVFDLTPGGSYKDRFATDTDQVCVAEIYFSRAAYDGYQLRRSVVVRSTELADRAGVDIRELARRGSDVAERLGRVRPASLVRSLSARAHRWIASTREYRLYEMPAARLIAAAFTPPPRLRVNHLSDLLKYKPLAPSDPSLTKFLGTALRRFEEGQTVFTFAEDELLHYSWLIPEAGKIGSEFGHQVETPDNPAVLWDDFTHPTARGRGLHKESLRARLSMVRGFERPRRAVIGVRADNGPSRHNIEDVGFELWTSAWITTRLGRSQRWFDPAIEAVAASVQSPSSDVSSGG